MYFNNKVDPVNISAYYPFTGTEGTAHALIETSTVAERQTPSEQQKFDFMYAVKENVKGSDPNVNLTFAHRMSKLTLIFKNGNDGTDVSKITECVMSRLTLEGSFNPATGDCAAKTTSPAVDFTVSPTVEDDGTVFCSLLLFPQSVSKVAMRIRDSEQQDFLCDLNFGADGLVPGNHYQFTITVNKAMLSVSNSILPWNKSDLTSDASSDLSQVIKPTPETEQ
ncbi:MAG: fimbrillin family protein, partial [Duncaniella sp.]|nr:fimbrillin family protein [Duncaniella sp.]